MLTCLLNCFAAETKSWRGPSRLRHRSLLEAWQRPRLNLWKRLDSRMRSTAVSWRVWVWQTSLLFRDRLEKL